MENKKEHLVYYAKTPKYPLKAYLVYFHLIDDSGSELYYPIGPIYTNISHIANEVLVFERNINRQGSFAISSLVVIVPLILEKLYPLRRGFWQKPTLHYSHFDRIELFAQILEVYDFYRLVVTPLTYQNKMLFISAIPVFRASDDKDIEKFMIYSDFPVDEKAKYAAIYHFGKPLVLNWQTGKTDEFKPRLPLEK